MRTPEGDALLEPCCPKCWGDCEPGACKEAARIDREASRVDAAFDRARDEGLI